MKQFLKKHLLLILIGILLIYSFFEEKSNLRFIVIIGIFIILNSFIIIVANSEEILHKSFPAKAFREENPKLKDKIWTLFSMTIFFLSLIFLIFEMDNLENTFEENIIWKKNGLVGFGFSLTILFIINKIQPTIFDESGRRYSVIFGFIFGISSLFISSTSFINREFSNNTIVVEKYKVVEKSVGGKRNECHWFFINYMGKKTRFKINEKKWEELEVGKEIVLKTQTGYLNYKFIKTI